ncbi:hypothetical protein KSF81_18605 [Siccirubricoccus sp. G192]|nr:hypothetical protein [Siccirubricoccus sp. G192]
MRSLTAAILCTAVLLGGCAGMSDTQQRALTGTTGGAAAGAVLGAIGGNAGLGAAAGAAAGLAGGLLYDHSKKSQEAAYQQGYATGRQQR